MLEIKKAKLNVTGMHIFFMFFLNVKMN